MATQPTVCMHCEEPVAPCAQVCPVMAILITPEGVVQQADPSRCIACQSCVYACPFGVPKIDLAAKLMKKGNLCFDRTSAGLRPWCAQACPTQALWCGSFEVFAHQRQGHAVREARFGPQEIRTRVFHVVPGGTDRLDIARLLAGSSRSRAGGNRIWQLALGSGAIFLGGLLVLWLLHWHPATLAGTD